MKATELFNTQTCVHASHLVFLLKFRHVHSDEALNEREMFVLFIMSRHRCVMSLCVYILLTFLISLCMYRAICLASSVLPAHHHINTFISL